MEIAYQLLHIVKTTFAREKLTGGNVKESHTARCLAKMNGGQEIVFLIIEHVVGHGHTRSDKFGDAALHQRLRQFGVFQLVANGDAPACPNQFGQVGVERMMGKTCHLGGTGRTTIVASGKGDAENFGGCHGIFAIGLIEVAAAKQHQRIGMLCLQREKLFHHRRQAVVFLCHIICFSKPKVVKVERNTK